MQSSYTAQHNPAAWPSAKLAPGSLSLPGTSHGSGEQQQTTAAAGAPATCIEASNRSQRTNPRSFFAALWREDTSAYRCPAESPSPARSHRSTAW